GVHGAVERRVRSLAARSRPALGRARRRRARGGGRAPRLRTGRGGRDAGEQPFPGVSQEVTGDFRGDDMITLYGFGRIFPEGVGETKDLRAQWARGETGLPYRVHALDHPAGDLDGEAYRRISPFRQVPVIDDDGFVVAESAAVVLYLAEKAGKLIPSDLQGRTRVVQWCFAATSTVEPTLVCGDFIEIFDSDNAAHKLKAEVRKMAGRWLGAVERRLGRR